jgi:MFS family permease
MTGEISSFFIDRFGRKTVTIMSLLISSLTIMSFTVTPLYPSLSARLLSSFFVSLSYSASSAITLEQVPRYRGAIMSLNMAAGNLGVALGSALSGLVFSSYGFFGIGPILGSMMIASSLVMKFLVVDPSQ